MAGTYHQCTVMDDEPSFSPSLEQSYTTGPFRSLSSTPTVFDSRSELLTPVCSRSPSVSGSADGGYASSTDVGGDAREEIVCAVCGVACNIPDHVKVEKKKDKEKQARADQAEVLRNAEDMFHCFFNWKPSKAQSSGNGNAAGIETPKVDLQRLALFFANKFLESGTAQAIKDGGEEQWKQETLRGAERYLGRWQPPRGHPGRRLRDPSFNDTFLEQLDKRPCRPWGKNSDGRNPKLCKTHPESGKEHVACRKDRRLEAYRDRMRVERRRLHRN